MHSVGDDSSGSLAKRKAHRNKKASKQRKARKRKCKQECLKGPCMNTMQRNRLGISSSYDEFTRGFWQNYSNAFRWHQNHLANYWKNQAIRLHNENLALRRRLEGASKTPFTDEGNTSFEATNDASDDSSSGCEIEVSEEFKQFLDISYQHKQELARQRLENKTAEQSKDDKDEEDMEQAPERDFGEQRKTEMGELYGSEGAKIHGMETALHLSFMRKCDKGRPVLWPVVALSSSKYM